MTRPVVSVVIPVFNGAATLGSSIESVLAQDYEPVELVVVDDGSTDASAAIASAYDAVRCLRQENRGVAAAYNAGLRATKGEFIAFHDADDRMAPRKLSLQVGYLLEHPRVDVVLGRQRITFDGVEQPRWMRRDPVYGDLDGVNLTSGVMRRTALEAVGGFDESFRRSEDRDLMVRLRAAGYGIEVLDKVVLHRSFHGGNLTAELPTHHPLLRSLKSKLDRDRAMRVARPEGRG